ncbi:MAG: phosphoribosylglycinamide formyltransferase [Bacteroidales bacterium]|nr:phosphoribosylglycinamide formyltransferase [Bacteroidales bacterium]
MKKIRIAIFASGNGTNAQRIIEYYAHHASIEVACVIYNRREAFVAQRAAALGVEAFYVNRAGFADQESVKALLHGQHIDYIILAGFLLQVPDYIINMYEARILNIHPSLLPRHGGLGMYGSRVHQSVLDSGDTKSGITIHLVDGQLDTGAIVFQAECPVLDGDTADTLADRVHELEHRHFPHVIEDYILSRP